MIRKTGLIRTMEEAKELYASEIKRVKGLVNKYLPDPRVFNVSVPSRNLPDAFLVLKPETYAGDQKTVSVPASIEVIPHINEIYVYDQFSDLDPELRIDWKLGVIEELTEAWFYEKFGNVMVASMGLINRIRKSEPPKVTDFTDTSVPQTKILKQDERGMQARVRQEYYAHISMSDFLKLGDTSTFCIDSQQEAAEKLRSMIGCGESILPQESISPVYQKVEEEKPADAESPFFFTDTKQIKVKKDKKKKSKKTKSSKSKRK